MRIVVAGASGLIGTAAVARWRAAGHDVVRLVRRAPTAPGEVRWDPDAGRLDPAALGRVDAAVDLAGAGVGDHRWTPAYRDTITSSRTRTAATLARALAALDEPPGVLLQASATGWYGDPGEREVREGDPAGDEFLARVCVAWEAAAAPARTAGVRTVALRTGLVVAPGGGAFAALLPLVRAGVAGPLGDGSSWWSWITLPDHLAAMDALLAAERVSGPVNLVSPAPARNREVVAALARAFSRPALVPAPAALLRLALGGFAAEVLASRRVAPAVLADLGFAWTHPDLTGAAAWLASEVRRG